MLKTGADQVTDGGKETRWAIARYARRLALALSVTTGLVSAATAQSVETIAQAANQPRLGQPSPNQPGSDRPIPEAAPPSFDFKIEAPRRAPVPRAVEELTFDVQDIQINGSTVYSAAELRSLIEPLVGKTARLSDIVALADLVEAKYRSDGYLLTRAFVPPQSVSNGIFQITVVEGYVSAVSVEGGDNATRRRVEIQMAAVLASHPLKLKVMETALLRSNELPGVNVSGLLRPSPTQPGASDLIVTVSAPLITSGLTLDNRGTQSTSRWTNAVDAAVRSPFGDGGQLQLYALSAVPNRESERYAFQEKYVMPLGADGLTVSLGALESHGAPIPTTSGQEVVSNSVAVGPRLGYPIFVSREHKLSVDTGLTWQSADIRVGGVPTSHDEWRVFDFATTYSQNGFLDGTSSLTFVVAHGLHIFGASELGAASATRTGGDPEFTKFSAVVRRVQSLGGPFSASLLVTGQRSMDTLLLLEEVNFGGSQIGRGYDPAAITGDNGAGASFELRYDDPVAVSYLDAVQYYLFYDGARIWNNEGPLDGNHLQSAGGGVRWTVSPKASFGLEYADELTSLPTNKNGGRAPRLLFNGSLRF
jgi:hemolysin activation/secretion protein